MDTGLSRSKTRKAAFMPSCPLLSHTWKILSETIRKRGLRTEKKRDGSNFFRQYYLVYKSPVQLTQLYKNKPKKVNIKNNNNNNNNNNK
jgi:hypothetical protein